LSHPALMPLTFHDQIEALPYVKSLSSAFPQVLPPYLGEIPKKPESADYWKAFSDSKEFDF
jgi:hypothetical protein